MVLGLALGSVPGPVPGQGRLPKGKPSLGKSAGAHRYFISGCTTRFEASPILGSLPKLAPGEAFPSLAIFRGKTSPPSPLASHAGAPQTARLQRRRGQVPRVRRPVGLHVVVLLGRQGQDAMALRRNAASHEKAGAQRSPQHHREGGVDAVASSDARQAAGCEAAKEDKEAARCQEPLSFTQ